MTATVLIVLAVALSLLPNFAGTPAMSDEPTPAPEPAEPAPDVTPAPPSGPTVGDVIARVKASETRLAAANEAYAADAAALASALKAIGRPVWERDVAEPDGMAVYEYSEGGFKKTLVGPPTTPVPAG